MVNTTEHIVSRLEAIARIEDGIVEITSCGVWVSRFVAWLVVRTGVTDFVGELEHVSK